MAQPLPVLASGPHVHGVATLEIAIDGPQVHVNLNSPLDNVLGFERAPRNDKEREDVKLMAAKLHQADNLFIFTPQAQCRPESTKLESSLLPPELLIPGRATGKMDRRIASGPRPENKTGTASPAGSRSAHDDEHAELEAAWSFKCERPETLNGADVRLFQVFPGLRRLDVAIVGPRGQRSARLSPASTQVKW